MPRGEVAWQKTRAGKGEAIQHLVVAGDLLSLCGVMSLEYSVGSASQVAFPEVPRCEDCSWIALRAAQMVSVPAGGESRG
jgi:hypothetical protein